MKFHVDTMQENINYHIEACLHLFHIKFNPLLKHNERTIEYTIILILQYLKTNM